MSLSLHDVVEAVADALDAEQVPYGVSGALAMAFHGYPRATQDVDLQVRVEDPEDLTPVYEGLPQRPRRIDAWTWRMGSRWDIELYPIRDALDEAAFETRVEGALFEEEARIYRILALEPLLVMKIREYLRYPEDLKHVADIRTLLARNAENLDRDRVEHLLALDPAWQQAWNEQIEEGSV